jgi:hypothetical protein
MTDYKNFHPGNVVLMLNGEGPGFQFGGIVYKKRPEGLLDIFKIFGIYKNRLNTIHFTDVDKISISLLVRAYLTK